MFARIATLGGLLVLLLLHGCSSRSELANSATDTMGDWSPVGSQQVTRRHQFSLAGHYHLAVAAAKETQGDASQASPATLFATELARQLRRYFMQVDNASGDGALSTALAAAREGNADILMLAGVQSWPVNESTGSEECGNEACDKGDRKAQKEMVLAVSLYDVRAGVMVDSVIARSRRSLAAFRKGDANAELEQLCKLIVDQFVGHQIRP